MSTKVVQKRTVFQERFINLRGDMTQKEFSKKIGMSLPTIGHYENGNRVPGAEALVKIADSCGVSCDYLLGRTRTAAPDDFLQETEKRYGLDDKIREVLFNYWHSKADTGDYKHDAISAVFNSKHCDDFWQTIAYCLFGEFESAQCKLRGESSSINPDMLFKGILYSLGGVVEDVRAEDYCNKLL